MYDIGLGPLTFGDRFDQVMRERVLPMLSVLDEGLDRQLPERIESDHAIDLAAEVEDAREFHYNWAHVIVTTAVLDTLRLVSRFCNMPGALRGRAMAKPIKGEVGRAAKELEELVSVDITSYRDGLGVLEGMVLARNKIVHNGGLVKEQGSALIPISIEREPQAEPSKPDPIADFPEYIAGDFIRVGTDVFDRNRQWCSAFLVWIDQQVATRVTSMAAEVTSTKPN